MDCTPTCRFPDHALIILSAITREDLPTFQSIVKKVCSNPANLTDRLGRHAIHVAASCGKTDILEWLVKEYKVDIGLRDLESGWTPLHRSVYAPHGADLHMIDKDDLTPLDLVMLDSPFKLSISVEGKVTSNYETNLDDELSLHVGDIVTNIHMTGSNYWSGSLNSIRGFFPKRCIQLTKQEYRTDLYTWGANTNFTLGHQDESLRQNPEVVEALGSDKSISIKQVVMCKFHSVFLTQDGRLYTCGHGRGGRLGHGDEQTQLAPKQVKGLKELKCISAAAAQDHTVVVTHSGSVFTFGLNDMHQLGHMSVPSQCLVPSKIQMKVWKGKHMIGVAAGRYHTVFYTPNEVYTCGLNIGQLGHLKGEKFHTMPRQVTALYYKDITISMVTCSDAATVCATAKGDIFLLSQYSCQKIVSRFSDLTKVLVAGVDVDLNSNYEPVKVQDHVMITLLNAKGLVYQWKESSGGLRRCKWLLRKELLVADVAVGKQLYIVTDRGEMFSCTNAGGGHPVVKPTRSSPIKPFGDWDQKDVINFNVTRCPMVHRGIKVFTDGKSKGFAVLQVDPSTGLEKRPTVCKSTMVEDFTQLLDETVVEDDIHDVHLVVKGNLFPAHAFILASRSPAFHERLIQEHKRISGLEHETIMTVKLDDVEDPSVLTTFLQGLYSGLQVNDAILFGSRANDKPTKKAPKAKEVKISNGLHEEQEDLSSFLMLKFAMTDLDNVTDLLFLDNDKENAMEDVGEDVKEKSRKTAKSEKKAQLNANQKRKKANTDEDSNAIFRGLQFKRTNCPEFHDVTIKSEDHVSFLCHKCILIARLDYFRSMLACGWLETSREMKVLNMPIHSSVLQVVLDFLYTDDAKALQGQKDIEFVGNVLVIADQLLIGRLTEICESVMAKLISHKNAMELLEFSCVYNASQLKASCLEFICWNLSSLLESGSLNLLSKDTLDQLSTAYRDMIPSMAWRMMTPSHDHLPFLSLEPPPSTPRRRRTSSRKRSIKSESEGETEHESNVSEEKVLESEKRERTASETNSEDVFENANGEENLDKREREVISLGTTAADGSKLKPEKPNDEDKWYRKEEGKSEQLKPLKSKKQISKQEKNILKPSQNTSAPQEIPKSTTRKEQSPAPKPAWGMSLTSATSPPSSNLRSIIMEQEQLTDHPQGSQAKAKGHKSTTSVRIEQKPKQSQKQKKKALKNHQLERSVSPEPENKETTREVKMEETKPTGNPWGLQEKSPPPVRSLRELIEQEERSAQLILPAKGTTFSPKTPNATSAKLNEKRQSEKATGAKRKISWGLPQVEQKGIQAESKEQAATSKEPVVSPRSAWSSSPSPGSPPSPSISFADILHHQERESTNMNRAKGKPLSLIQLEDLAIQELLDYYGGQDCACEMITVERVPSATATPVWNRTRTAST